MARRKLKQKCLTGVSLQCLLLTSDRITLGLLQVSLVSNGMIFTTASFFEHMGRWLDTIMAKLLSYHFFFEALFTHLFPYRLCPSCSRYLHPHINVQQNCLFSLLPVLKNVDACQCATTSSVHYVQQSVWYAPLTRMLKPDPYEVVSVP